MGTTVDTEAVPLAAELPAGPSKLSFVIPAHDEEAFVGRTIASIRASMEGVRIPYEIVVVDDASSDRTGRVASEAGAAVVRVEHRKISATRNAGAKAATGELLVFVDADTLVEAGAIRGMLAAVNRGAAGGGIMPRLEPPAPVYARVLMFLLRPGFRLAGISAGAFMFCTRRAFDAVGGFDEGLYGAEDGAMSAALRGQGRFTVLTRGVTTSSRRVRATHGLRTLMVMLMSPLLGPWAFRSRQGWARIWYGHDYRTGSPRRAWWWTISDAAALIALLLVITFPLWWLPWPAMLMDTPLRWVKMTVGTVICVMGLTLCPATFFLLWSAARQKSWARRVQWVALACLCGWLAWVAANGVVRGISQLVAAIAGS